MQTKDCGRPEKTEDFAKGFKKDLVKGKEKRKM
jgi:hypothetical protein